ncbi:hypothetical protein BDE36_2485 [Arcticibacter tournemirensis]|nr:hypothetical protein [Arcticibacter tournemirensis]TQM50725.1 hypothetical protein BDE36_2485 [Arcticibacter tournemirensis]
MIASKFRFFVLLPVVITIIMLAAPVVFVFNSQEQFDYSGSAGFLIFISSLYLLFLVLLIMGELRAKAIVVSLNNDSLEVKNFLGLGRPGSFSYSSLEGYRTSAVPSRGGTYEYLYLIHQGKKIAKISEFYHRNYEELKASLQRMNIKNLGEEQWSFTSEMKELFS